MPDSKPSTSDKKKKPELYVVLDKESNAVEYGPAPDKDAAEDHCEKMQTLDARGTLAEGVGRDLAVFKLVEA